MRFAHPGWFVVMAGALGCASDPETFPIEFVPASVDLDVRRDTIVEIRNVGVAAVGPLRLVGLPVVTGSNVAVAVELEVTPEEIATLNPGASRIIALHVATPDGTPDNAYSVALEAQHPTDGRVAALDISFLVNDAAVNAAVTSVEISGGPASIRQGDVIVLNAEARGADGAVVEQVRFDWTVLPAAAGFVDAYGRFVAYEPGEARVVASAGLAADTVPVDIAARNLSGSFDVIGHGSMSDRFTSDLWVHGDVAYTGTWGVRSVGSVANQGNTLYVWDIANPTAPTLEDSVEIDARVVNDVKIRSDGRLAVITHEGSADGQNGITLLDLTDPLHPSVITRFTSTLQTGVHNAWVDEDFVYLVVDGASPTSGLRILDISQPSAPRIVTEFYGGSSFLHDVYVREGLAFLSHWDAGLVILDVGNGIAGGSPESPVEVGRVETVGGQTHNAWYWPEAGYVFVGEEDFGTPGVMHVIEVSTLGHPIEVATFRVPGTTPHNFWMDESNEILYLSWYNQGIHALDVSGQLMGELDRQGREIAGFNYNGAGGCFQATSDATCNWAPQLHDGLVYLSDANSGLWVLQRN